MNWFARRKPESSTPSYATENLLEADTLTTGTLKGAGGFRIEGSVEGSVDAGGPVVVGENGVVRGDVRGAHVVVLGRVEGNVDSLGHVEVGPKGSVEGDLSMLSLRVQPGGHFRGSCRMAGDNKVAALPAASGRIRSGATLPPPKGEAMPPAFGRRSSLPPAGRDADERAGLESAHDDLRAV